MAWPNDYLDKFVNGPAKPKDPYASLRPEDQMKAEDLIGQVAEEKADIPARFDPQNIGTELFDRNARLYRERKQAREAGIGLPVPGTNTIKAGYSAAEEAAAGVPPFASREKEVGTADRGVTDWLAGRNVTDLPGYEAHVAKKTPEGWLSAEPNSLDAAQRRVIGTAKSIGAILPAAYHAGEVVGERATQFYDDVQNKGLGAALQSSEDPIGTPLNSASKKTFGQSLWQGIKNTPAEVASIAQGVGEMADRFTAADIPMGQRAKAMGEGAVDFAEGTARSFAKTVLDPQKSIEDGLLQTVLNAGLIGGGLRRGVNAVAKPLVEASDAAARKSLGAARLAKFEAADELSAANAAKAESQKLLDSFKNGPHAPPPSALADHTAAEAWVADAAKLDAEAAKALAKAQGKAEPGLIKRVLTAGPDVQTQLLGRRNAIRAQAEPLLLERAALEKAPGAGPGFGFSWADLEADMAAARKVKARIADIDAQLSLHKVGEALADLDAQIAKNTTAQAVKTAISRIPEYYGSAGVMAGYDLAKMLLRKVVNRPDAEGFYRRWLAYARDQRLPPEFQALSDRVASQSRGIDMVLDDTLQAIPEQHRPRVRDVLHAETEPLFRAPSEGGKPLIEWDAKMPTQYGVGGYKLTDAGYDFVKSNMDGTVPAATFSSPIAASAQTAIDARVAKLAGETGIPNEAATKVIQSLDVANKYARPLALQSVEILDRAKKVGFPLSQEIMGRYFPNNPYLPPTFPHVVTGPALEPSMVGVTKKLQKANPELMRKHKVPPPVQEALYGRSTDLAQDVMGGLAKLNHDVAMHELFSEVAKDKKLFLTPEEMAARKQVSEAQFGAQVSSGQYQSLEQAASRQPLVSRAEVGGYVQVPNDPAKWGKLSGGYLQGDVMTELRNAAATAEQMQNMYPRAINLWKKGKTAGSIKTGERNLINSAMVTAPLADMSLLNPARTKYYAEATKALVTKKPSWLYRMAVEDGLVDSGFQAEFGARTAANAPKGLVQTVAAPAKALIDTTLQTVEALRRRGKPAPEFPVGRGLRSPDAATQAALDKAYQKAPLTEAGRSAAKIVTSTLQIPVAWYGSQDMWFKLAKYYRELELAAGKEGVEIAKLSKPARLAAATKAADSYVNYGNLPGFGQVLRAPYSPVDAYGNTRLGSKVPFWVMPTAFVSYPLQAAQAYSRLAAESPWRAKLYMAMGDYLTGLSRASSGANEDEVQAVLEAIGKAHMTPVYRPKEDVLTGLYGQPETAPPGPVGAQDLRYLSPLGSQTPKDSVLDSQGVVAQVTKFLDDLGLGVTPPLISAVTSVINNRAEYTGKPVAAGSDDTSRLKAIGEFLARELLPPVTPIVGDQWKLIADSGEGGKPDYTGKVKSSRDAWAELLTGTKTEYTRPQDAMVQAMSRMGASLFGGPTSEKAAAMIDEELRANPSDMPASDRKAFAERWVQQARPRIQEMLDLLNRFPPSGEVSVARQNLRSILRLSNPEDTYAKARKVFGRYSGQMSDIKAEQRKAADAEMRAR